MNIALGIDIGGPDPVGDEGAPLFIGRQLYSRIDASVQPVPALGPEGPVPIRPDVLEEESLVAKPTGHQLCRQSDGCDVDPLAICVTLWRSKGLHGEQVSAVRDPVPQLGVPFVGSPGLSEHRQVGLVRLKRELVGDADLSIGQRGAVLKILEDGENAAAERPLLTFEQFLLQGGHLAGVAGLIPRKDTGLEGLLEEVPVT